jgi:hypothetical protein
MAVDPKPQISKNKWHERLGRAGYFFGALMLHLILFVMLATLVIFKTPAPSETSIFSSVSVKLPPPPPTPPAAAGGEAMNALEPDLTVTPPVSQTTMIQSISPSAFRVDAAKVSMPNLPPSMMTPSGSGLSGKGKTGTSSGGGSVFGSDIGNGTSMQGYFYDLKQTPDHKPTGMTADIETSMLKDFFQKGWNEDDFASHFLKSSKPLFSNEILIPFQFSSVGPKAFGLEKVCEPGFWAVIYHIKVTPSQTGNYFLAGYGDDFLVVRVNEDVVLDSGWFAPVTPSRPSKTYPPTWLSQDFRAKYALNNDKTTPYGRMVVGDRFHLNAGETITVDVFIGDADPAGGQGQCGYFLFLLEDGKDYDKDTNGTPLFPLFQIQANPDVKRDGIYPPFTCKPEDSIMGS